MVAKETEDDYSGKRRKAQQEERDRRFSKTSNSAGNNDDGVNDAHDENKDTTDENGNKSKRENPLLRPEAERTESQSAQLSRDEELSRMSDAEKARLREQGNGQI